MGRHTTINVQYVIRTLNYAYVIHDYIIYQCQMEKNSLHAFHDTNDPTTIYGNSGKLHHMLSVTLMAILLRMFSMTLTIQRPYMVDLGCHRKLSCHTRTYKI